MGRRRRSRAGCSRPASSPCRGSDPEGLLEQLDHPGGGRGDVEAERLGELAGDLGLGALGIELDVAAEEVVGVDAAEDEVQVGDGDRLEPAVGPADPDARSRRIGAELGPPGVRVDADERSRPGADGVDPH
jgi:hypothetical protein